MNAHQFSVNTLKIQNCLVLAQAIRRDCEYQIEPTMAILHCEYIQYCYSLEVKAVSRTVH